MATCRAIAADIEQLSPRFPQLASYRAASAQPRPCWIMYERHTHSPQQTGGWSAGVPAPDPDGVWFYIGLWDPTAPMVDQINTQPVTPNWWIGERRVTLLVKDGERTAPVGSALAAVLQRHGMITKP